MFAVSRDRDTHGQVSLKSFEDASKQIPNGFRKTFLSDPNAAGRPTLGFWSTDTQGTTTDVSKSKGDISNRPDEDVVNDVYDHMETEDYFMDHAERMRTKLNEMQDEMEFLRNDLSRLIGDFDKLVKHLQKTGVKGANAYEESPREDPKAWYDSRKKLRKDRLAAERVAAHLAAIKKSAVALHGPSVDNAKALLHQQPEVSDNL